VRYLPIVLGVVIGIAIFPLSAYAAIRLLRWDLGRRGWERIRTNAGSFHNPVPETFYEKDGERMKLFWAAVREYGK